MCGIIHNTRKKKNKIIDIYIYNTQISRRFLFENGDSGLERIFRSSFFSFRISEEPHLLPCMCVCVYYQSLTPLVVSQVRKSFGCWNMCMCTNTPGLWDDNKAQDFAPVSWMTHNSVKTYPDEYLIIFHLAHLIITNEYRQVT